MLANWFALTTGGYASWAALDATSVEQDFSTSWTVIAAVSADLSPEYDIALSGDVGVLDGSGTIGPTAEASLALLWQITTAVEADLAPFWQITQHPDPRAGTIRIVGQQPTVATTVFYAVQADFSPVWTIADEAAANLTTYWAIESGERATPTAGRLRLVGQTPTLTRGADKTITPSAGVLRLVGKAPTLTSPVMTYPIVGVLRIVGVKPYIQPQYVYPRAGTVRLVGTTPTIVSPIFREPSAGTLRIVGRQWVASDLVAVWPIIDSTASSDFEAFWNLDGSVSGYLWAYWHVERRVGAMMASQVVPTIQAAGTTQSTMTARTTSNRITLRAA